ncbi:MAG: MerR family transcriptional regulator [Porcipelethomonas sp.]
MYSIGAFSKLTKTTIATLRFYDKEGLLKPAYINENTGYRYYLSSQLTTLQKILSLRHIGMPVEQIKEIISSDNERCELEKYQQELKRCIIETQQKINIIQIMLNEENPYDVIVKELDECIVYSKTEKIKDQSQIYNFIETTDKIIFDENPGLKWAKPDYAFLSYLDNEYRSENMKLEICKATNFKGKDVNGIVFKTLPKCKVASLYYRGSYEFIGTAFTYLYDWINKSGYKSCGTPRECFIDGFWNVNTVDLWLTEIQIPIE